ncbi:MAG TPA: hypothetical protein VFK89_00300 [Actinomycetota bacterium]|nr:hypothetical protein [Actinomycetota bacterium]
MRKLAAAFGAALLLGACSSAAAPGAGTVLDQVDKAKDVKTTVECQQQSMYGSGGGTSAANGNC